MTTLKKIVEIDLIKEGLVSVVRMEEAHKILRDVYGSLWAEAYYDPYNESTQKFAKPLADQMTVLNDLLEFKS